MKQLIVTMPVVVAVLAAQEAGSVGWEPKVVDKPIATWQVLVTLMLIAVLLGAGVYGLRRLRARLATPLTLRDNKPS